MRSLSPRTTRILGKTASRHHRKDTIARGTPVEAYFAIDKRPDASFLLYSLRCAGTPFPIPQ